MPMVFKWQTPENMMPEVFTSHYWVCGQYILAWLGWTLCMLVFHEALIGCRLYSELYFKFPLQWSPSSAGDPSFTWLIMDKSQVSSAQQVPLGQVHYLWNLLHVVPPNSSGVRGHIQLGMNGEMTHAFQPKSTSIRKKSYIVQSWLKD